MIRITIVTPVYNEEQVIAHFHERTKNVIDNLRDADVSIVYVVDRCTDNTLEVLRGIIKKDKKDKVISLSSRFGHQMSLMAGIENSLDSDAIIMMDSDLQHPPEVIPSLVKRYRQGYEVVYTIRKNTERIAFIRKLIGNLFYMILGKLSQVTIHANAADFRLISGRVASVLSTGFHERNMFLRGLFSWMGFKQTFVEYYAGKRYAGQSKYSFTKMIQLATAGILSFSTKPLQTGIFIGIGFASLSFVFLIAAIISYFIDQTIPSGWTTIVVMLLLFSGIQLIILGIIGTYIGGIYEEVKCRPRYIIEEVISYNE